MSKDYQLFKHNIAKGLYIADYYDLIISLRQEILSDIHERNQGLVAKDLKLNPTHLSIIVKLLRTLECQ